MIKREKTPFARRKKSTRLKIKTFFKRPRLSVFRSDRYIYAQIINDRQGRTLVAASEFDLKSNGKLSNAKKHSKKERARLVGKLLAQRALKTGIKKVVFDRNGYKYHGRVKALAEGAREGGLIF